MKCQRRRRGAMAMSLHYVAVRFFFVFCVSVLVHISRVVSITTPHPTNLVPIQPHTNIPKTKQAALEELFSAAAAAPLALAATNPHTNEDEEEGNEDDDGGGCWAHLVMAMRTHARDDPRGVAAWHGQSLAARRKRALLSGGRGVRVGGCGCGGDLCVFGLGGTRGLVG